jgi:hypothetical protein
VLSIIDRYDLRNADKAKEDLVNQSGFNRGLYRDVSIVS